MNFNDGKQYGLIAQELQEVFPELVPNAVHPGDEEHESVQYLGVDYIPLTAILVQAIQEQQTKIDGQQAQIETQSEQIEELMRRIESLENK
jgi:hypothetical protein